MILNQSFIIPLCSTHSVHMGLTSRICDVPRILFRHLCILVKASFLTILNPRLHGSCIRRTGKLCRSLVYGYIQFLREHYADLCNVEEELSITVSIST